MTGTSVVIPNDVQLPARLRTPEAAQAIARANAEAAGGVKAGGFPRISTKDNMFHFVDGGTTTTIMDPDVKPGQPAVPIACFQVVAVASNPALSRTYYKDDWVPGMNKEPDCRSSNSITPDADAPDKQHPTCYGCPQAVWGAEISKITGKPKPGCAEHKQLAVIPAGDLEFKAAGFAVAPASLGNWGKYCRAMDQRGYPINQSVTNITFMRGKTGVVEFGFSKFLNDAEAEIAVKRATGDDVQLIVAQSRTITAPVALPPPASTAALAPPIAQPTVIPVAPVTTAPAAATFTAPPATGGFGAAAPTAATGAPATLPAAAAGPNSLPGMSAAGAAAAPTRKRRTRAEIAADEAKAAGPAAISGESLDHIPQNVRDILATMTPDNPARAALLAAYPRPVEVVAVVDPLAHLAPNIRALVEQHGVDSPVGVALLAANPAPTATVAETAPAQPAQAATAPAAVVPAVLPVAPAAAVATPPATSGFGATLQPPAATAPASGVSAAAQSLQAQLMAKLASNAAGS